ncbi:MAG: hypothetical protein BZY87_01335 [SAR202 cluster bacterium Io17-Chloro-G6]|nr:MAG: hypothetical protein BZY87_01335 [SAR202 cluster bacterium Io17-Chloro-G6]
MLNGNFFTKAIKVSTLKSWNLALIVGAIFFLAAACVVVEPTDTGTDTEKLTPPPTDTPVPADQLDELQSSDIIAPDPEYGTPEAPDETPEKTVTRRTVPERGTSTVQRIPDTPVPEPGELLPKNTLALVMAVQGGSSSFTLKTVFNDPGSRLAGTKFIELESSSKSVVLLLPDSGEATVIDSYTSPSYAPHFKRPYTIDDHLYVSNKFTNGGALSITEYATDDLSRSAEWGTQSDALDPGYAVAGGRVYFHTGSTQQWSMSRGFYNAPGDYMSSSFSDRWASTEMEDPEFRFSLVSGGDTLYGARLPSEDDPITGVFTVDPDTGQPADRYITAFEIEDWNDYHFSSWRHVVIENGTAYWVGFLGGPSNYAVEILAADLADPDNFAVYEFDIPSNGEEITGFNSTIDADGGYVLIKPFYEGGDRTKLLIYDTTKETAELINTGFDITDAQLIYIEG